jgi:hypothetical protein
VGQVLFAVMGGDGHALLLEITIAFGFIGAAVIAFMCSLWIVVVALAGHGLFDLIHHQLFRNGGVPFGWPGFCSAFDFAAAIFLGVLLVKRSNFAVKRGSDDKHPLLP